MHKRAMIILHCHMYVGKDFYNKNLEAKNILEIDIDIDIIRQSSIVKALINCEDFSARSNYFSIVKPSWGGDIRWISSKNIDCYTEFAQCFRLLSLPALFEQILDYSSGIRMYAGFMVERSSSKISYHTDWNKSLANNAFTLLTPIHHPPDGLNLIYKDLNGREKMYQYKYGKAILIGSELMHSTEPGASRETTKLLCFQFGTDLAAYNQGIVNCMGTQCEFFRLPDGRYATNKNS